MQTKQIVFMAMKCIIQYVVMLHIKDSSTSWEERADCFTLISFLWLVTLSAQWLFITALWVGIQCVIVVFPSFCEHLQANVTKNEIFETRIVYKPNTFD